MNTLIKVFQQRSEEFVEDFKNSDVWLEISATDGTLKIDPIKHNKFIRSHNKETVVAILEAVMKDIGEDEKYTMPDMKDMYLAGNANGDNLEVRWAKHCIDKNANRNFERAIRNEERNRLRQIILSTLQNIKNNQK